MESSETLAAIGRSSRTLNELQANTGLASSGASGTGSAGRATGIRSMR